MATALAFLRDERELAQLAARAGVAVNKRSSSLNLATSWKFLRGYLEAPQQVGAIAPSGRALAIAICEPFRGGNKPATVLEVGAGTGAITRHIGSFMQPGDELDVCEIRPEFADVLRNDVLTLPVFRNPVAEGRVRVLCKPVQQINEERKYDFVISGLPFTAFDVALVQEIFAVIRRCLKPGGVFSYYEYIGLRRVSTLFAVGAARDRFKSVSGFLSSNVRRHQFHRRTVLQNLPPAHARHLRFESSASPRP